MFARLGHKFPTLSLPSRQKHLRPPPRKTSENAPQRLRKALARLPRPTVPSKPRIRLDVLPLIRKQWNNRRRTRRLRAGCVGFGPVARCGVRRPACASPLAKGGLSGVGLLARYTRLWFDVRAFPSPLTKGGLRGVCLRICDHATDERVRLGWLAAGQGSPSPRATRTFGQWRNGSTGPLPASPLGKGGRKGGCASRRPNNAPRARRKRPSSPIR